MTLTVKRLISKGGSKLVDNIVCGNEGKSFLCYFAGTFVQTNFIFNLNCSGYSKPDTLARAHTYTLHASVKISLM